MAVHLDKLNNLDIVAVGCATFLVFLLLRDGIRRFNKRTLPLPPGPSRLPVLGNVHQLPADYQYKEFGHWRERYGDVIFAKMFQTPALILNSLTAAQDLLEKRSGKYSDRPRLVMLEEVMGWDNVLTHFNTGARFRKHRKWITEGFSSRAALESYRPVQLRETYVMLAGLLENPRAFRRHISRWASGIVMDVTYGHRVHSLDDKYVKIAKDATDATADLAGAGSMIVDFFPILKHLPPSLPGAGFLRNAVEARVVVRRLIDAPYEMVKAQMSAGKAQPSFITSLLEEAYTANGTDTLSYEQMDDIKGAAAVIYGAGSETSVTVLTSFFLAMVRNPEVVHKAQQEIDRVVGPGRLPDHRDRENLPYVDALLKEVYRWNVPVPLGLPHRVTSDDEYRGYHIPRDSMIIPNIWQMSQNREHYPDPENFRPERYLETRDGEPTLDPRNIVFGFGRRLCPGQQFADASLFLAIACILAVFDITKMRDADGNEITPPQKNIPGFLCHPVEFACDVQPRSKEAAKLIAQLNVAVSA